MVVDRDGEHLLRVVLPDHVVVEHLADLARRRHAVARLHQRRLVLLADDVHAQLDALVADEHRRARDELADLVLALPAEGAVEGVLAGAVARRLAHADSSPLHPHPPPGEGVTAWEGAPNVRIPPGGAGGKNAMPPPLAPPGTPAFFRRPSARSRTGWRGAAARPRRSARTPSPPRRTGRCRAPSSPRSRPAAAPCGARRSGSAAPAS